MKIALVICPQWSDMTPSFALGSLKSNIDNPNVEVKQFDLNVGSSLHYIKNGGSYAWNDAKKGKVKYNLGHKFTDLMDWDNERPWSEKEHLANEVIPYFKDYWQDYIEELSTYDVVVFTVYTSNIMTTDYIARYIKQINKNTQIWYGGPFSWYCKSGGLEEDGMYREFVDVACSENEGELIIKDLVDKYYEQRHYENIAGIWRWNKITPSFPTVLPVGRSGRTPVFNGRVRAMILDTLKAPSWDKEVMKDYFELCDYVDIPRTLPIQSSRGCTFKCTFCQETRLYRYKSFDKIVIEMKEQSEKYGIDSFWFTDSLINGSMKKFEKFIEKLEEEDLYFKWTSYFRTHKKLDTDLLTRAVKHGLQLMNAGTENGVNKILALMEKNQTSDDVSFFLKSAYESHAGFYANWIPGYPKETYMDFLLQVKFIYDNAKYFERNGTLNLMLSTDILPDTPLDVHMDDFEIMRDKEMFNSWISTDYKNILVIRHLRGFFINLFAHSLNIPVSIRADRYYESTGDIKKNKIKPKTKYTQDFLVSEFLHCEDKDNFDDVIKQEIIQVLKSFSWIIHNVADDYDFKFDYRDNFIGYNCDGSTFKLSFELNSGELSYDFSLLIDKNDSFLSESMEISDKDTIILKGNKKSDKVEEFYLDSMDYKKHSVNYKRTSLTNQY